MGISAALRSAGFTPSNIIAQGNRVTRGRVNTRSDFRYNTRFPQQWSKHERTQRFWQAMVELAEQSARRNVRVGPTGNLKGSISSEIKLVSGGIIQGKVTVGGPGLEYWAFIEYGTGRRGSSSPKQEPGKPAYYRYGKSAGNRAYPFMRPALMEVRQRVQSLGA